MIEQKDIVSAAVICDQIRFSVNRENTSMIGSPLNVQVTVNWGACAIRQDNKGIKSQVEYIIKSPLFEGEVKASVIIDLNCETSHKEVSMKENQKRFALMSVNYIVSLVSDLSSKMGISPLLIPSQLLVDLIEGSK